MIRNENLEALSNKIRKGEPVGILDTIAVINYQEHLRREREANSLRARGKRLLHSFILFWFPALLRRKGVASSVPPGYNHPVTPEENSHGSTPKS